MGLITFTDATGAAQLDNGMTAIAGGVGSRFVSWVSETLPVGPIKTALGTGLPYRFQFRVDYVASFEMQDIPNANVAILDRLIAWLLSGGVIQIATGDAAARTYNAYLAEGAVPKKAQFNKQDQTWALSLRVVNDPAAAVPMTCIYSS